ncbi:MAG: hypothetical protein IKF97_06655 [Clostridia bacterium]|nr:hypothetical protein [Clostridia bacterium]
MENVNNGILHILNDNKEYFEIVKDIENKEKIIVYHCILEHTTDELILLYVSNNKDNWSTEIGDLAVGFINTYKINLNNKNEYEIAEIEIQGINKGISQKRS